MPIVATFVTSPFAFLARDVMVLLNQPGLVPLAV